MFPRRFFDAHSLALQHFHFTQFADDLFRGVSSSFFGYCLPLFSLSLSFYLDQCSGGRSNFIGDQGTRFELPQNEVHRQHLVRQGRQAEISR